MNNEQEKIFRNLYHQLIRDKRKRKILKIYNYG